MALLPYTRQRLRSFISEIERAYEPNFPYPDSKAALDLLKARFEQKLEVLAGLDSNNPEVVARECQIALRDIGEYLPFIGFVLRSITVRNSFEAFGPFLRLAVAILEPGVAMNERKTRLVFSSEWDYSPFMFHRIPQLEHFIFIGLPAPESSNPLLLPLAGHELGHALWHKLNLETRMREKGQAAVFSAVKSNWTDYQDKFPLAQKFAQADLEDNMIAFGMLQQAFDWCTKQAEETFCDFVALGIFCEAYLHAFAYMLSPGYGKRSQRYPEITARVKRLAHIAPDFGVVAPEKFEELFEREVDPPGSPADKFLLKVTDEALGLVTPELVACAKGAIELAPKRSIEQVERVFKRIEYVAPADDGATLSDIVNAAWTAYNHDGLWADYPKMQAKKPEVLKELILKNLEIFEIEQIQGK